MSIGLIFLLGVFFLYVQNTNKIQNRIQIESHTSNNQDRQNSISFDNTKNKNIENISLPQEVLEDFVNVSVGTNDVIVSPVVIEGQVKKDWFEQGKFSVFILDEQKNVLGNGFAVMKEELFDEPFVPFIATIDFFPTASTGFVVLQKNTSPVFTEKAIHFAILVQIKQSALDQQEDGCKPSGCSGQICSDQNVITDCAYKEEYICYQKALCARQENGSCGWTQTKELVACLSQFE